jgi:uncharacterized membrane protein YebE (DUF533 family)
MIQNLLNQFMGSGTNTTSAQNIAQGMGGSLGNLANKIPVGLAGGAAAGSIMALLVSNKSARKFAGTAAGYGGAAILGGLAYKALKSWQHSSSDQAANDISTRYAIKAAEDQYISNKALSPNFEMKLIKAMIAAANADGHIDQDEQQRIFQAIDEMDVSMEMKAQVLTLLRQPISLTEIAQGVVDMTQKSELYLVSCLAINADHPSEHRHLDELAQALKLPEGLADQIQQQAQQALIDAA